MFGWDDFMDERIHFLFFRRLRQDADDEGIINKKIVFYCGFL